MNTERPEYVHAPNKIQRVLGSFGLCWCGEPGGHDWAGKEEKEPHPR